MNWIFYLFLIGIGLFVVDRIGLWAERKGWVYWRHKKPGSSGGGNALMELQSFFNPSVKHHIEMEQKKEFKQKDERDDDIEN